MLAGIAVAFPPATVEDVDQDSITLGGLDCGTSYDITVEGGGESDSVTQATDPCPTAAPDADLSISPDPAVRLERATFTYTGTCEDTPCSYTWHHWDSTNGFQGQIGTGTSATFTYSGPAGSRGVGVRVTDAQGRTDQLGKSFQLVDAPPEAACATSTPDVPDGPDPFGGCWPGPATTGPSGLLTASSSITTGSSGQTIENRDITGSVTVNHANVTIRNSRITSNAFDAIRANAGGLTVEDVVIRDNPGGQMCHNGIRGSGYTVRRTEITGCENGAHDGSGNLFQNNWVHDLAAPGSGTSQHPDGSPHTDGIQDVELNSRIAHNWIDPVPSGQSCTSPIISNVNASGNNVQIRRNWLDGRGCSYAMYANRQTATGPVNYDQNRMLAGVNYAACVLIGNTVSTFDGNRDALSGAPLAASQMDNSSGCRN